MNVGPVADFAWFAAQAGPGNFMCAICYEYRPLHHASVDENGDRRDVCLLCEADEQLSVHRTPKEGERVLCNPCVRLICSNCYGKCKGHGVYETSDSGLME